MNYESISVPGPTITPISEPFWNSIEEGKLSLQQCVDCKECIFYPRAHCPHCFSSSLIWKEASGKGVLKNWSIIHRAGNPAWDELTPYVVGIVELEEGPSMLTHLLVDPSNLDFQMEVILEIRTVGNARLPFFKPRQEERS